MTRLANKDIEITSNTESISIKKIRADANLINQAFNNLVKNSINAIKERQNKKNNLEIKGKINIELSENDSLLILKVVDNGIGFPEEKEHLMEPYISRSKKGSGLGLAVVKKIMEDHKGTLELNNNNNNIGANVTLLFPISLD